MILRNTTSRLVALHLLLVAASTALSLGFVYWSTTRVIEGEVRGVVQAEIAGLEDDYARSGVLGLARAIQARMDGAGARDAVYLLTDVDGNWIAGNLTGWPPTVTPGAGWVELDLFRRDRDRAAPIAAASLRLDGGERLLVGRDAQARVVFRQTLWDTLIWALAVMTLLSLGTGWLLSRLVRRRIADVGRTAQRIARGDMGGRVPVRGTDAFDELAGTLNAMLDRIETLVLELRTVTDSIAHDLRTPLTRLRHRLTEAQDADEPRRSDLIASAEEEAAHVLRSFGALLEIARMEAGYAADQRETIDLAALVTDIADLYGPVGAERGVEVIGDAGECRVAGHRQALAQALTNLVENALRYAPEGSVVRLGSGCADGNAWLAVADAGPGIAAQDQARAVQRFTTLDPSRQGSGAGLGLALVAAVARMHGGRLELSDNAPGLVARLELPAAE